MEVSNERALVFCSALNEYLIKRYGYKTRPALLLPGFRINVSRSLVYMYARLRPNPVIWGEDTLVLAKLGFKNLRRGNGASFLKFLVQNYSALKVDYLGVEQAGSLPMLNFVQKYNFKQIGTQSNWKISFNSLKSILK